MEIRRVHQRNAGSAPGSSPSARLRIALLAPPFLPVPPLRYGGTERILGVLANGLHQRGHDVTLFAAGDSNVDCRVVPVVPESLWKSGWKADPAPFMARVVDAVAPHQGEFDVIHSHLEWHGFEFARRCSVPVVSTIHGRIDTGPTADLLGDYDDVPLVAISAKQRSFWPNVNWVATIPHGLPMKDVPIGKGGGGYLLLVGRLTPEKGVAEAVQLARSVGMPLVIAAKAIEPRELETYRTAVEPGERDGTVTFVGEVPPHVRDQLLGDAEATLMLGDWPEPFGLVAVESLATGTPVIGLRLGALPEIIRDGVDGFVVDDLDAAAKAVGRLGELDRDTIRAGARDRFSAHRMVDAYVRLFRRLQHDTGASPEGSAEHASEEDLTPLGVT